MYADDTTLIYAHKDLNKLKGNINKDLEAIHNYCKVKKLCINANKSKAMYIKPKSYINYNDFNFFIGGKQIEQVSSYKFLGIMIDNKLSFNQQATHVISKLTSINYVIYKLRSILPRQVLKTLFNAAGLSQIYYGDVAYLTNCTKSTFSQIESRFIDCGRTILFNKKGSSRTLVRATLNWFPLDKVLLFHQCIFLFKCI